jgi:hypothetical protein
MKNLGKPLFSRQRGKFTRLREGAALAGFGKTAITGGGMKRLNG